VRELADVPAIYKTNIYPLAIKLVTLIVVFVFMASLAGAKLAVPAAVITVVAFGTALLIESRRSVILSLESFKYRWGIGNIASGGIEVIEIAA